MPISIATAPSLAIGATTCTGVAITTVPMGAITPTTDGGGVTCSARNGVIERWPLGVAGGTMDRIVRVGEGMMGSNGMDVDRG